MNEEMIIESKIVENFFKKRKFVKEYKSLKILNKLINFQNHFYDNNENIYLRKNYTILILDNFNDKIYVSYHGIWKPLFDEYLLIENKIPKPIDIQDILRNKLDELNIGIGLIPTFFYSNGNLMY